MIELRDVSFSYKRGTDALRDVTARIDSPQLVAIAGPNGSGKSTLLDILAGLKTPSAGTCLVNGRATSAWDRAELCQTVSHVPQQMPQSLPFTVEEVVLTGRTPHSRGLYDSAEDLEAAEQALHRTGIDFLRGRRYSDLSGGEQQRVLIAAAICQQPSILLLDEPAAHLDPKNEAWLWQLLEDLSAAGTLVIVVTHHLALAARHATRAWLMRNGRLEVDAAAAEAMQPGRLSEVFDVPFHRITDASGRVYLSHGY